MSEHGWDWSWFWEGWESHREASKPLYRDSDEPPDPDAFAFWNPYHDAILRNDTNAVRADEWWRKGWRDREREVSGREA